VKWLWVSCAILIAILVGTMASGRYLQNLASSVGEQLQQAQTFAEAGDWSGARDKTSAARSTWQEKEVCIHITLRHSDINEVYKGFERVEACVRAEEYAEYAVANAELIAHLELINQSEMLDIENVL